MASCIPPKVPGYLQRIREQYKVNEPVIYKVLSSAKVFVRQDSHFDPGYNAVGHDISLFFADGNIERYQYFSTGGIYKFN